MQQDTMPSSASHNRDGCQQRERLTEELNDLGLEITTELGVSNLSHDHIHDLMQHLNYLAGGRYDGADFSYDSYIRALVQILHRAFHHTIVELTVISTNEMDVQKIIDATRGRDLFGVTFEYGSFVILCQQVVRKWLRPTEQHIVKVCNLAGKILVRAIKRPGDTIYGNDAAKKTMETLEKLKRTMHAEARKILSDELGTPFTLQDVTEAASRPQPAPQFDTSNSEPPQIEPVEFDTLSSERPQIESVKFDTPTDEPPKIVHHSQARFILKNYCLIAANRD
ncbi:hypothetical protein PGTUg99_025483 [Puccinia graminis f. sp. tritici]|uniref:Uncharacterized protein n=1 Tax=Puccinia graminis f. sp. tritici TaxID=56615 RepID=A0A5B0PQT2_PUCGR|nr:hypothetical protein PGTUg99_025483 [Puccinia graminis f. sp. tritici]